MQVVALLIIVTTFHLNFAHAKARLEKDVITYPEESPEDIPEDPESEDPCKDLTYCTVKPKNYPEEKFNKMFKNYKVLPQPALVPEITFENRLADLGERDNCKSKVEYAPLYQVREKREDAWRIAIQVPQINFTQSVRMETCVNPDAKCFTAYPPLPEYVTFCKQKYVTWEVLVVKNEKETELIKPQLPVCCSCHYKPLSFIERFGGRSENN